MVTEKKQNRQSKCEHAVVVDVSMSGNSASKIREQVSTRRRETVFLQVLGLSGGVCGLRFYDYVLDTACYY